MSKFQWIIIGIFIIFIVVGVVSFANFKGTDTSVQLTPITIWGTFPADIFDSYVSAINNQYSQVLPITYVEKRADQFNYDFISALARGQGPDAILLTSDIVLPYIDKIALIPYTAMTQREFKDRYIQESDMYISQNGILALPFVVDPLVMYWNKDTFNAAGVAIQPKYWDEFGPLTKKLTDRDNRGNIKSSTIAFGHFENINNAREILGTLIMQTGNPITTSFDSNIISTIKTTSSVNPQPALEFFTQFANPNNAVYSWNRSMPDSKISFLSGNLATYFGFASELQDLREKNPNLNFDVTDMPQLRKSNIRLTYGKMYGFSLVKSSKNLNGTYQIISIINSPQFLKTIGEKMYLPSVRRDIIASGSEDPYIQMFNRSALISRSWIDADPGKSRNIFGKMIDSLVTGRKSIYQAIQDAGDEYDVVLKQAIQ